MTLAERVHALVESLDKICSACVAARSQADWDLLHRNKPCKVGRRR